MEHISCPELFATHNLDRWMWFVCRILIRHLVHPLSARQTNWIARLYICLLHKWKKTCSKHTNGQQHQHHENHCQSRPQCCCMHKRASSDERAMSSSSPYANLGRSPAHFQAVSDHSSTLLPGWWGTVCIIDLRRPWQTFGGVKNTQPRTNSVCIWLLRWPASERVKSPRSMDSEKSSYRRRRSARTNDVFG